MIVNDAVTADTELFKLRDLLIEVLDDATGDIKFSEKRIWPIRMSLWRKIYKAIGYKYDSDRSMGSEHQKYRMEYVERCKKLGISCRSIHDQKYDSMEKLIASLKK